MDRSTISEHLRWVEDELARARELIGVLTSIRDGYVELLRLISATPRRRKSEVTMVGAAVEVLRSCYPEAMHVSELWRRVEAMGAVSNSSRPNDALSFALRSLAVRRGVVEKVGPATWRWCGDERCSGRALQS